MKYINLESIVNAFKELTSEQFEQYLSYIECEIKNHELIVLDRLIEELKEAGIDSLNNFFVGYQINQIGKEFDLLRFGKNGVINIELKCRSTYEEIFSQLEKNSYYLSILEQEKTLSCTYNLEENKFYKINKGVLEVLCIGEVVDALNSQQIIHIPDIHSFFKPSNYLVSPFNSTEKFLESKYFLTQHQNNIRREILNGIDKVGTCFIAIKGNPGTGKTLLTYDVAKQKHIEGRRTVIIHCGWLNEGHDKLIKQAGYIIYSIRDYKIALAQPFDLLIIDESQRLSTAQFYYIISKTNEKEANCIFSYDARQVFKKSESSRNIPALIEDTPNLKLFELTDKVRTNKEISSFIKNLFDVSKINATQLYPNISIQYFSDESAAKTYIEKISSGDWEVLNYTNSLYNRVSYDAYQFSDNLNAHDIIGQEFDNVLTVIDENFFYDDNGRLSSRIVYNSPGYDLDKMFYQIITRARQKIILVIIKNPDILNKCLNILGHKQKISVKI